MMSGDYATSASLLRPQPSAPDLVIQQIPARANYCRCFGEDAEA
jgi:hypothetical protein